MHIWDAFTGQYLGFMHRAYEAFIDKPQYSRQRVEHSERDARYAARPPIDSFKVSLFLPRQQVLLPALHGLELQASNDECIVSISLARLLHLPPRACQK